MQLFECKFAINCVPLPSVAQVLCIYNRKTCKLGRRDHKTNEQNKIDECG